MDLDRLRQKVTFRVGGLACQSVQDWACAKKSEGDLGCMDQKTTTC